ncbi:MAG: hypothetical protein IKU08_06705 [Clostridia bacterium]|nr:hypothetical protein [Clostridia bacterium]
MATLWQVLMIVSFVLAGLSFMAAVFVFFYFKIPSVIGDLTGRTVAKEVKAIRAENREKDIRHRSRSTTPTNAPEKRESDMSKDNVYGRVIKSSDQTPEIGMLNIATDRLDEEFTENAVTNSLSSETMVLTEELTATLGEENATTVLEEGTTVLSESEGTTVLSENEGTTVLSENEGTTVLDNSESDKNPRFAVTDEELFVSTKEVIV